MNSKLKLVTEEPKVIDIHALQMADIPDAEHWKSVWEKEGSVVEFVEKRGKGWR
jgi:hypothetical protein